MTERFGPKNREEEEIFAVEGLIFDVQYEIQRLMRERGLTQKALAERLGCSRAWVSQLLSDKGANMTLETIARVFFALKAECSFASALLSERSKSEAESSAKSSRTCVGNQFVRSEVNWAFGLPEPDTSARSDRTGALARFIAQLPKQSFIEAANENSAVRKKKRSVVAA